MQDDSVAFVYRARPTFRFFKRQSLKLLFDHSMCYKCLKMCQFCITYLFFIFSIYMWAAVISINDLQLIRILIEFSLSIFSRAILFKKLVFFILFFEHETKHYWIKYTGIVIDLQFSVEIHKIPIIINLYSNTFLCELQCTILQSKCYHLY